MFVSSQLVVRSKSAVVDSLVVLDAKWRDLRKEKEEGGVHSRIGSMLPTVNASLKFLHLCIH